VPAVPGTRGARAFDGGAGRDVPVVPVRTTALLGPLCSSRVAGAATDRPSPVPGDDRW